MEKGLAIDIYGTPHRFSDEYCPLPLDKIAAKQIGSRYFVRASQNGDLFWPDRHQHLLGRKLSRRGVTEFEFCQCSKACFDHYVSFLRSKNKTALIIAQRRYLDG